MKVKAVQVPSMFDYYVLKSFKVNGTVRNKYSFEWFLEVGGFDKGNTWEHLRLMLNPRRKISIDLHYQTTEVFLNDWNIFHQ